MWFSHSGNQVSSQKSIFEFRSEQLKSTSKMMRLMDKVIFVVVVLCCANQALCQSDATTNSTVAGNIADLTEGRWMFALQCIYRKFHGTRMKMCFCYFIYRFESTHIWTSFIEASYLCHHSNCFRCRCDSDVIGCSNYRLNQRTWRRRKYSHYHFTFGYIHFIPFK